MPSDRSVRRSAPRGFTLVEILIVVVILGILAAFVVPQLSSATDEARQKAFVSSLRSYITAVELVRARTGSWPEDATTGIMPVELAGFADPNEWSGGTPLGGSWDTEAGGRVGVHFDGGENPGPAIMTEVDRVFDDGNITTGRFRQTTADRYYYFVGG